MPVLKFKKLNPNAILPRYQREDDSGFDICSLIDIEIPANSRATVPTGLTMEIPKGHEVQIRSRSGLAHKQGAFVLNSPGTIDNGYRGELMIIFQTTCSTVIINAGDRIAQGVLVPVIQAEIVEATELSETQRGIGGLGSTGVEMKTTVVNMSYHQSDTDIVYIGRAAPLAKNPLAHTTSVFHNPFKIGRDGTRAEVVTKYKEYLYKHPELIELAQRTLKGKKLGCWCSPSKICHGEVLVELLEESGGQNES